MIITAGLFALACVQLASCLEVCCYNTAYIPPDVGCYNDAFPFDVMPLPHCNDFIQVGFRMYTRDNSVDGAAVTKTTIPSIFKSNVRTHFIVHGYLGSGTNRWMHDMKDFILQRGDYNVIIVSWPQGSRQISYPQAASDTRVVGTEVALVAMNLVTIGMTSWDKMYCTGHSLGSHVCGHAGQRADQPFGRITGMDPAGPMFEGKDHPDIGLDPTDALLVDVMHTSGEPMLGLVMSLGTMKRLGHIDFYPNGGGSQPGCIANPNQVDRPIEMENVKDVYNVSPACSHMRVLDLYIESITQCTFTSYQSCTDQYNLPGSCVTEPSAVGAMGFDADAFTNHGIFYLETNGNAPFCM